MIRSARKVLYGLLHENPERLDDEQLSTLFCEVECVLNNRPLTKLSEDADDLEPLTPKHLLRLRAGPLLPCGEFTHEDMYIRQRWRRCQYLVDRFWSRWSKEYLLTLQQREKWHNPSRCVEVGDIVLIMDNAVRNSWALGRVIETVKDKKGLVRIASIHTATSVLRRPIHKLCLLLEADPTC